MLNETAFDLSHEFVLLLSSKSCLYRKCNESIYSVVWTRKLLSSLNTPRRIHDFLNPGLNYTSFK